jgi:CRISPR-associated DxTHG motif protein
MKLLTFLGTGNYQPATYTWEDRCCTTNLFPEALAGWLQPEEMLVLLTKEARDFVHWGTLQERLAGKVRIRSVGIPSGESEAELWKVFQELADSIPDGEEVVFDVTHAFRSLPILSLLAAAYLRVAKAVKLNAVLYGAYEARDADNRAPVFNLTPFVRLLDWITATDRFIKSGDAADLSALLGEAHQLPWRSATTQSRDGLPRHLKGLGSNLHKLTQALLLARPPEVAEHATAVNRQLAAAAPETARFAQPFVLLLERTQQHVGSLASDNLQTQRQLVHWYVEHDHAMQALTLAREWLVSWVCQALGLDLIKGRDEAEKALTHLWRRERGKSIDGELSPLLDNLAAVPQAAELLRAWDPIGDLRNDVAHCGYREKPRTAGNILQAVEQVAGHLDRLSLPEG